MHLARVLEAVEPRETDPLLEGGLADPFLNGISAPVRFDEHIDGLESGKGGGVPLILPAGRARHANGVDPVVPERVTVALALDDHDCRLAPQAPQSIEAEL